MPLQRVAAIALAVGCAPALAAVRAERGEVRATPLEGPAPRRPAHTRGLGSVAYATPQRAYFDVGAADGLVLGTAIVARRGDVLPGRCSVDLVAEHAASCKVAGLRPGDVISYEPAPEPPEPKVPPPVVPETDLLRRAAVLEAAPAAPLVVFRSTAPAAPAPEIRRTRWFSASAGYAQWTSSGAGDLGAASVELAIRGAELGAGVTVDLAARGERWNPAGNPRFRPADDTRFYLWQAELTAPISRVTLSAGRVLPYAIPGASIFDGAAASLRLGPAEVGLFGGVVPEPDTTNPATDRSTGGAFWSLAHAFGARTGLRQDGRIAVVRSPELGTRYEATLGGGAWWKAAHLSAETQLGAGGEVESQGQVNVDALRLDLSANVLPGLSVGGGYRYTDLWVPDAAWALEPAIFSGRSTAADGWASWDLWIFRVGASGGFSRDAVTKLDRSWVGPEIGLPRLLGGRVALAAGYLEERGWLEGRSAWVQATYRHRSRLLLTARGTWTRSRPALSEGDELGLLASGSAELGRGFGVRATVLARSAMSLGEDGGAGATGIAAQGAVYASF